MRSLHLPVILFVLTACAPVPQVKPTDMSAAAHRREADRERAHVARHLEAYDAKPRGPRPVPAPWNDGYIPSSMWWGPRDPDLAEAEQHALHAVEHEEAAAALETFEEEQCLTIPDEWRGACYRLGPIQATQDVDGGVAILLEDGADGRAIAAHLRCHYAWARARGFQEENACPFDLDDLKITVTAGGRTILLTSGNPRIIDELRRRAREVGGH